ncbi:MAG: molybdopterin-guanine dinucleotide biosynthesis protein B, partial [Pseudomonadota bacterium]
VKHAHHAFDIDHEGTDSFRHRAAGAGEVVLVSAARMATMVEFRGAPEPSFTDVLDKVAACDLILVEGYRREDHAKLEVRRTGQQDEKPLPTDPATILAIITEEDPLEGKPHFHPHAVDDIADFVEKACGLKGR